MYPYHVPKKVVTSVGGGAWEFSNESALALSIAARMLRESGSALTIQDCARWLVVNRGASFGDDYNTPGTEFDINEAVGSLRLRGEGHEERLWFVPTGQVDGSVSGEVAFELAVYPCSATWLRDIFACLSAQIHRNGLP